MANFNNIFNSESINPTRLVGTIKGSDNSPSIIIFAGIHGNEMAGVKASKIVLEKIKNQNISFKGNLYVVLGNLNALKKGIRYEHIDLNRIWKQENIITLNKISSTKNAEEKEQLEIYYCIKNNIL